MKTENGSFPSIKVNIRCILNVSVAHTYEPFQKTQSYVDQKWIGLSVHRRYNWYARYTMNTVNAIADLDVHFYYFVSCVYFFVCLFFIFHAFFSFFMLFFISSCFKENTKKDTIDETSKKTAKKFFFVLIFL